MDNNFCSECGARLEKDVVFCPQCGFKIKEEEIKTKFCHSCGEKVNVNAEICPKCGVRLINPLANTASDVLNKSQRKIDDSINSVSKYLTARNVIIVVLLIIIITLIYFSPTIIDHMTPYKQIDESYFSNIVAGEKVQFDGEYVGHTGWTGGYLFLYSPITNNDIVKVGDEYVILQGDYLSHNLYGNEGSTVHLEGRFASGGLSHQPLNEGYIDGYWFGPDTFEIVG